MPAQQHFAADHRTVAVECRHVDQPQLVVAVQCAQLVLDQADSLVALFQLVAECHRHALAFGLGLVHGGVGAGEQLGDGVGIVRIAGGADAEADRVGALLQAESAAAQAEQRVVQCVEAGLGIAQQEDGEFVAGQPGERRIGVRMLLAMPFQQRLGALGEQAQQGIAGIVAVAVVDLLEVVQVDEQQRQALVFLQALFIHDVGQHAEVRAVADLRQAVGPGDLLDALQRGGAAIVQGLHVDRQTADLAAVAGLVEGRAFAQQQVGELVVQLADGCGDVAADQPQQQPDGQQADQRTAREKGQPELLQTLGGVVRRRRQAGVQRARQRNLGGQADVHRQLLVGDLHRHTVFALQCPLELDESLGAYRQLDGEGFTALARQRPTAAGRQDEVGVDQQRSAIGLFEVDRRAGSRLPGLLDDPLLRGIHRAERRQAALEVVGRLAIGLHDGEGNERQFGVRQRANALLQAKPEGVVAKGGVRLAQEVQQRLAVDDRVEHAAVERLVVQIGRLQRRQLLLQTRLLQAQQRGALGQVGGGRGNQLDDQNDREDHQQRAFTERHGR